MNRITDEVAIGNYLETRDVELLKQHGFRSILSLDGTLTAKHAAEFGLAKVASYRLIDGPGNDLRVFRLAINDLSGWPGCIPRCWCSATRARAGRRLWWPGTS